MPQSLMPEARHRYFNNDGTVAAGCLLYTYAAGTSTPKATYTDSAGLVPHDNPIELDAKGEAVIYWDGAYKVDLKTAAGVQITGYPVDNYTPPTDTLRTALAASNGSSLVGFISDATGAIAATVEEELQRRRINVFTFMTDDQIADVKTGTWYTGDVAAKRSAMYASLVLAESWMRTQKVSLYFPDGHYEIGDVNMPWRNASSASLLDYSGTALFCSPGVTFATVSSDGADVFQLNAVKNFSIFGFPRITASLTGLLGSGSNGVSVTNGFDGLHLEIFGYNLPSVDATTFVDGGKALTIQPGTTSNECGSLRAIVRAVGCSTGFGADINLVTMAAKNTSVDVQIAAIDCYRGVVISAAAASAALDAGMSLGMRVRGQSINCQQDVVYGRVHGVDVDLRVKSTKTAAALRLDPSGVAWRATDTEVSALNCAYAHNSLIKIVGYKDDCDYKARIGGATAGSSGLIGRTEHCDIYLDIGGSAATADISEINSGGNTMANSTLVVTGVTASSLPAAFRTAAANNRLRIGSTLTGSFTGSLTGCTTVPTGTIEYSIEGDVVTLEIPSITGTSNATGATITGMPADLYPTATQTLLGITTDNGTNAISRLLIGTTGTITLNTVLSSVFTAAGTKGVQACSVTYRRR